MAKTYYLAGPMTGYPRFNFDAFDKAAADLRNLGYEIISPVEMDRTCGFDPDTSKVTKEFLESAITRDIEAVRESDGIILLPGWEKSTGATAEFWLSRWVGIEALIYPSMQPVGGEDVLLEALRITSGDRQNQYGPADQDFKRTAIMWSALKGIDFSAREVAMFMICLKLSRETHQKKRDNAVDICGYARLLHIINEIDAKNKTDQPAA